MPSIACLSVCLSVLSLKLVLCLSVLPYIAAQGKLEQTSTVKLLSVVDN